ncbi:MAG: hypothetical protein WA705_21790 [Candidatus Ozemobacteraceae bacterium]
MSASFGPAACPNAGMTQHFDLSRPLGLPAKGAAVLVGLIQPISQDLATDLTIPPLAVLLSCPGWFVVRSVLSDRSLSESLGPRTSRPTQNPVGQR